MNKITLKNVSSSTVIVTVPDINFRRELLPNREIPISKEDYEGLIFDPGVDALIQGHYIIFNNLEENEQTTIETTPVYSAAVIKKMLEDEDIVAFTRFIPHATDAEKDSVVKLATELRITNSGFIALIKKYCDVDIISAINIQHQLKE